MHGNLCATGGFILEEQEGFQEERRGKTGERSGKKKTQYVWLEIKKCSPIMYFMMFYSFQSEFMCFVLIRYDNYIKWEIEPWIISLRNNDSYHHHPHSPEKKAKTLTR